MPYIEIKKDIKFEPKFYDDENDKQYDEKLNIYEIITKFNKNRSDDNDTWIKVLITCINLYYRKIITRANLYEIYFLLNQINMTSVKLMKLSTIMLKDILLEKDMAFNTYWSVLKLMMRSIINK